MDRTAISRGTVLNGRHKNNHTQLISRWFQEATGGWAQIKLPIVKITDIEIRD